MSSLRYLYRDPSTGQDSSVAALQTSTGAGDANKVVATTSTGKLDPSLLPVGVEIQVETAVMSEALTAGDFVNFWNDTGTIKVRKADASNARTAHGFVLAGGSIGGSASVYTKGVNTQLVTTGGSRYFLSATTPGGATTTPVAETSGFIHQVLGVGVPSGLLFEFDDPIYIV